MLLSNAHAMAEGDIEGFKVMIHDLRENYERFLVMEKENASLHQSLDQIRQSTERTITDLRSEITTLNTILQRRLDRESKLPCSQLIQKEG